MGTNRRQSNPRALRGRGLHGHQRKLAYPASVIARCRLKGCADSRSTSLIRHNSSAADLPAEVVVCHDAVEARCPRAIGHVAMPRRSAGALPATSTARNKFPRRVPPRLRLSAARPNWKVDRHYIALLALAAESDADEVVRHPGLDAARDTRAIAGRRRGETLVSAFGKGSRDQEKRLPDKVRRQLPTLISGELVRD